MNFGEALEVLKKGGVVRLPHWASDVMIACQRPDENSKMTAPYLYVNSHHGRVPWKETMIELFSENWVAAAEVVGEIEEDLEKEFHDQRDKLEKAVYAYACMLDVGKKRELAFEWYEKVRNLTRRE